VLRSPPHCWGLQIYDDTFPLVLGIAPRVYDEQAIRAMAAGYERFFRRNEPYALLYVTPGDGALPDARSSRLVVDWVNSPRVLDFSSRLCVGSAAVVSSWPARKALNAVLLFWSPPWPLRAVATVNEGLAYCLDVLRRKQLLMGARASVLQRLVGAHLRDVL
jgi:hypothetical protein